MEITKILAVIDDKEYSLTVEVLPSEEGTIYHAVPDQEERFLDDMILSYIEFDEHGVPQLDEKYEHGKGKEVADAIWRAIKEQVINAHVSFNQPLNDGGL